MEWMRSENCFVYQPNKLFNRMHNFLFCLIISISVHSVMNASIILKQKDANIQIIHNSADTSLRLIDIYLNDKILISSLSFRKATSFFSTSSDTLLKLDLARSPSNSSNETIFSSSFIIEKGKNAVLLIQGVYDTINYQPNPNGKSISLSVDILENINFSAKLNEISIRIINGCTDLKETNLIAKDVAPLLISMRLRSSIPKEIMMPATEYDFILVEPASQTIFKEYKVNLTEFGGQSMVLFFSGFENQQKNQNGKSLGIYGAKSDGTIIDFQNLTLITETELINSESSIINITKGESIPLNLDWKYSTVYDLLGNQIKTFQNNLTDSKISFCNIQAGIYLLAINNTNSQVKLYKVLVSD